MNGIALAVAEDLHFDMPGSDDIFFQQHAIVAEAGRRLALAGCERLGEILRRVHPAHALAAAASHRLDEDGIADGVRLALQMLGGLVLRSEERRCRERVCQYV